MGELRKDMLPDPAPQAEPDISEDVQTPVAPEEPTAPETVVEVEPTDQVESTRPPKGYVSIQALHEERRLRKEAQAQVKNLSSTSPPEEEMVEEPDEMEADSLRERVARIERENLYLKNPELTDKKAEFEEFLTENPEYPLESAAKIFKAENGLYQNAPARAGLERPTGGPKTAPQQGYTPDQLRELREEHPRKYAEYIRSGKIKPSEINW